MKFNTYLISELIDEIAMGPFGSNIKVECFVDDGIPVLNGSNLEGFELSENSFRYVTEEKANSLNKANAYKGDVVITHRGTLGQIVYIPETAKYERYIISQSQFRIKCNEKIMPEYLVYYFHTPIGRHKLLSNASQVGVPALARPSSTFQKIEIELPDIATQRRIVSLLSSIQRKITDNNNINENLEQQAQAIFKSWFVDFEPFDGVMPEDWNFGILSDIAEVLSGKRPPMKQTEITEDVCIPLVGAASVMGYTNEFNHNEKILVIGRVGTHGIVQRFYSPCWTSDNTLVIKSRYYEYVSQILQRIDYKAMNRGSTQPLITQGDLKKESVLIPNKKSLLKYESIVGSLMHKVVQNQKENERLAALRDTLLPKLMNGEIDVSEVKI